MGMLRSCLRSIKSIWHEICCCHVKFRDGSNGREYCVSYHASVSRKKDSSSSNPSQIYLDIQSSPRLRTKDCFGCQWYFHRRTFTALRKLSSNESNSQLGQRQTMFSLRPRSMAQRTNVPRSIPCVKWYVWCSLCPERQRERGTTLDFFALLSISSNFSRINKTTQIIDP